MLQQVVTINNFKKLLNKKKFKEKNKDWHL